MQPNESEMRKTFRAICDEIKRIDNIVADTYKDISKCESYLQSCDKKSQKNADAIRDYMSRREQSVQTLLQGRMHLSMQLRKLNTKLPVQRQNMHTYRNSCR